MLKKNDSRLTTLWFWLCFMHTAQGMLGGRFSHMYSLSTSDTGFCSKTIQQINMVNTSLDTSWWYFSTLPMRILISRIPKFWLYLNLRVPTVPSTWFQKQLFLDSSHGYLISHKATPPNGYQYPKSKPIEPLKGWSLVSGDITNQCRNLRI